MPNSRKGLNCNSLRRMGRRRIKDSSLISCERECELKVIERWSKDKRWCKLKDTEGKINMGGILL